MSKKRFIMENLKLYLWRYHRLSKRMFSHGLLFRIVTILFFMSSEEYRCCCECIKQTYGETVDVF